MGLNLWRWYFDRLDFEVVVDQDKYHKPKINNVAYILDRPYIWKPGKSDRKRIYEINFLRVKRLHSEYYIQGEHRR